VAVVFWSVKGGSGTSVVSALTALGAVRLGLDPLLIDLAGDQAAVLGVDKEPELGVRQWLDGGSGVSRDALTRLGVRVVDGLTLVGLGDPTTPGAVPAATYAGSARRLLSSMGSGPAIIDAGTLRSPHGVAGDVLEAADRSVLVTRPCFLALRRASSFPLRPTEIVLVDEPKRSLDRHDIEDVMGVPVIEVVRWSSTLARAVDAGQLTRRGARSAKAFEPLAAALLEVELASAG